ncbi:hypothetical protein ACFWXK_29090 [Streptomyces sp. NPDC059070]|uniref:hypothetical protein n=1 Tax=Streptomyces sp. NPDC059070 TaxID=3346713 RepID=UPI0036C5F7A1
MGWAVLYIAFGVVALWLLGEVLLQYKARLRWRLMAFAGFMGVVLGVLLPSVFVIVLGALAFAVGQTYVTLSFRRGFSTGWSVGGRPGASRRRRAGAKAAPVQDPVLQVSDMQYEAEGAAERDADDVLGSGSGHQTGAQASGPVHEPLPLPDETGQYGVYTESAHTGVQQPYGEYDAGGQQYADPYAGQYGYGADTGQQQYAAYSDPYIGSGTTQAYGYDTYTAPQQPYGDAYAQQYGMDTPPGGVWVPQQRDGEQRPYGGEEQNGPYPHNGEYGPGHTNEQQPYRY